MRFLRTICWMCAFLGMLHVSIPARSQTTDTNTQTPSGAPAQPPSSAASPAPDQAVLKPAELDGLVAPIALYPDALLANVLMASTYPLEVVRAERWVNQNKNLKDDALKAAAEKQAWDASVKALVAAPAVLQMMSERLDWTQKLGEAFLAQEQDVMDAVQRMRARAYDRKKLETTKEQVVSVKQEQNRQVISIEPAVPDTLYVPYYEPQVVYGDWPYADYPAYPYYWGYPGYIAAGVIATGLAFGGAYALGRWASGGYGAAAVTGAAAASTGPAEASTSIAAPTSSTGGTIRRIDRARATTMRTCNSGSVAPIEGPAPVPAAARRLAPAGRTSPIALSARTAVVVPASIAAGRRARAGRPATGQAAARNVRSGRAAGLPSHRAASRAGHFRPSAGMRHGGGARFAGGGGARRASCRIPGRRRLSRWWRLPRRWRRSRWWAPLGHRAETRCRAAGPARQRPRLLPLRLQWQREGLCRGDCAGSQSRTTRCGRCRSRRLSSGVLRTARTAFPIL